ncbi:MAG: AMP-binding protein, partial [Clostridia bacterium]|nr:AMP-binding protein [Clostridia bacterium]
MNLLSNFLPRVEFDSYEDFKKNYKVTVPEGFNFAYDVVDEYARLCPEKQALVHVDENEKITRYTFADIKRLSDKSANVLRSMGIGRGDAVMMMMKERPEAWVLICAAGKLGAVIIPATYQLTPKDIVYRCEAAGVKLICMAEDSEVIGHMREAREKCSTLEGVALVGEGIAERYGDEFVDWRREVEAASDSFSRVATKNDDTMLIYFSSGTTGMPKMIAHNFTYPLGHITTAKYWHHVEDDGVHFTMADSGWAKFAWG